MRSRILAALMLLVLAAPAGAVLTDVEPANDSVAGAPIQMSKTGPVTMDAGELVLVAGDIDFVGIAALAAGDVVTVTTTPLDDVALEVPNTIVGLFDSSTTDPTWTILCRGDDIENNELITQGQDTIGLGSLCRFEILAPGNYYVGVTGWRARFPPLCDPEFGECSSHPFDGGIGPVPCEESGGDFVTCGNYQVTIAVNGLPEPGAVLQLVSGGIGLAWLNRRRNRRMTPSLQEPGGEFQLAARSTAGPLASMTVTPTATPTPTSTHRCIGGTPSGLRVSSSTLGGTRRLQTRDSTRPEDPNSCRAESIHKAVLQFDGSAAGRRRQCNGGILP